MESISIFSATKQVKILLFALVLITAGCSFEKESAFNRRMQDLTAHFNILFNARELLRQKQESYATSFIDNYNEILSVYQDTTAGSSTADKDLDAAITKANTIINVKEQSRYVGDAYLVLGKANYLGANYFNAVEYFSYVIRSFPKRADLAQEALAWKARSLIYLNQLPAAKLVLDTALQALNPKKRNPADVYAAKLQYDIDAQEYAGGEEMAKQAIQYCRDARLRLRWKFILAQLQELNHEPAEAIKNYSQIAKSNSSFEMAFNASLNRIRIEDREAGIKISRIDRLRSLLKDPNNKDFNDQVYFQMAELQMADKDIDNAIKNYNHSVRASTKNQNQKGLSYLRLATINFKNKADYLRAKKYYDSTLTTLSTNYPGYQSIQKLTNNLQLLTDRLQVITREDTLQALARMDEKTRAALIDKMVNDRILQQQAAASSAAATSSGNNITGPVGGNVNGSSFYFYNSNAVTLGFADFRQKWGNRKLEDNWRRSDRSNTDVTNNSATGVQGVDPDAPVGQAQPVKTAFTAGNYRQELLKDMPLTGALLAQSNARIYTAYLDIGNFYRDILDDKREAIADYERMLSRFPDDVNKPAIYYNLYRLNSELAPAKSDLYKNRLLKEYAETPFAKIISDPDYARKLEEENAGFTRSYNDVFDLYIQKKYKDVIACVPEVLKQYPGNKFSAQLLYLQALAVGHTDDAIPFRDSLQQIATKFPNDRLITPLVNQHLAYINANLGDFQKRGRVLSDADPHEIPFTLAPELKEEAELRTTVIPGSETVVASDKPKEVKQPSVTAQPNQPLKPAQPGIQPNNGAGNISGLFSMRDSTNYYFVVKVSSGTTNLASSRFGIGQFNRANYQGLGIRHQLKAVGADAQLIYIGRFASPGDAKKYAREIIPLMPDIMKVPIEKYSFFIITQQNLDKLADEKTLDSYIDYYQKNY